MRVKTVLCGSFFQFQLIMVVAWCVASQEATGSGMVDICYRRVKMLHARYSGGQRIDCTPFARQPSDVRHGVFLKACEHDEPELVKFLIQKGHINVHGKDNKGSSAVHHAAQHGRIQVFRALLEHGASQREQGVDGRWPIHVAAEAGHKPLVEELFGDDVLEHALSNGRLFEHSVAAGGNWDLWMWLEKKKPKIAESTGNHPRKALPPLFCAIAEKKEAFVVRFLREYSHAKEQKLLPNRRNPGAYWPVICAAVQHNLCQVVATLRAQGKSLRDANKPGRTTAAHLAAEFGRLKLVRQALEIDNFDVHTLNGVGWDMLQYAAMDGHVDVVAYLVSKGADPYRDAGPGYEHDEPGSAIHTAAIYGQPKLIEWFRDKGYRLDKQDPNGKGPGDYAQPRERDEEIMADLKLYPELQSKADTLGVRKRRVASILSEWMRQQERREMARVLRQFSSDQ